MGVVAIVGLAGDVEGRVIIDMSKDTAIRLASTMNGEELTSLDELGRATISEVANMVTAQAVTALYDLGFQFDLTPPAVIVGDNIQISDSNTEALVVPLDIEGHGVIEVNVAIRERL